MIRALSLAVVGAALLGCRSERVQPSQPAAPAPSSPATPAAFRVPADSEIPADQVGASIRRGRAIVANTKDSLPDHVGSTLRCTSCHLDLGTRPNASPWVGVYSRFPQYRPRNGKINVIQDRINDCIRRSLNGRALEWGGRDMADIIAYMAFLSRGVAPPGEVPGQGFARLTPLEPDTAAGRLVYASQCARCHGADGEGVPNPDPTAEPRVFPPLWGPRSFNVGAGMARLRNAASFIRHNMPFDKVTTLTDQQAFDVAGYMLSHSRPDFADKALDWPNGDPPPDVAYPTNAAKPSRPR